LPKRLPAPAALPSASLALEPRFQPALAEPLLSGNGAGGGSIAFSLISSLVLAGGGKDLVSSAGLESSLGAVMFFGLSAGGGGTSTFFGSSIRGNSTNSMGTMLGLIGLLRTINATAGISAR
jgi:hypothetical protein